VLCCSGCFAGGAAVEAGGGVVAHERQLQAVARLDCSLPLVFRFTFSSLPYQASSLSTLPVYILLNSLPCFKLPCILSFLSLCSLFSRSNFSPLLNSHSASPCFKLPPPPFLLVLGAIFIGQRESGRPYCYAWRAWLYCPAMVPGWLASGCGWQGATPSVSHHERAWGFGSWQSMREERDSKIKEKKTKIFFLPLLHVQGKKKEEQYRSKQHSSVLFYIYIYLFIIIIILLLLLYVFFCGDPKMGYNTWYRS
jgi:hypothetical protein